MAYDVEECAARHILTLQSAGEDIRSHQPGTQREPSLGQDQIVIPPAAAIESLAVPANGRIERLDQPKQREQASVKRDQIAADLREIGNSRPVPRCPQWVRNETEKIGDSQSRRAFESRKADQW